MKHALTVALGILLIPVMGRAAPPELVLSWSHYPDPEIAFTSPGGVATDPSGDLWATDAGAHRLVRIGVRGRLLASYGAEGTAPGEFSSPRGLARDATGRLFVADRTNHRIQVFDDDGTFVREWGSFGSAPGQFFYPMDVAVDGAGNILVADYGNHRIQLFDTTGTPLDSWGRDGGSGQAGSGPGEFRFPAGICVGPDGSIYVADSENHRVQRLSAAGTFLAAWGTYGTGIGEMNLPYDVAADSSEFFVVERANKRIQRFDLSGNSLGFVDESGPGWYGDLNAPERVALSSEGLLLVSDAGYRQIKVYDPDIGFQYVLGTPSGITKDGLHMAEGIAADHLNHIYVADRHKGVSRFTRDGVFVDDIAGLGVAPGWVTYPVGLAVDETRGWLYVADSGNDRIQKLTLLGDPLEVWGSTGSDPGKFDRPEGVALGPDGSVYVTDCDNFRVQKFSIDGEFVTAWGDSGSGEGQFLELNLGISVDAAGFVYVTDGERGVVEKFTENGQFVSYVASNFGWPCNFYSPCGSAVDDAGRLYVGDYMGIKQFLADGSPGDCWGNGHYHYGICIDRWGDIYAASSYGGVFRYSYIPATGVTDSAPAVQMQLLSPYPNPGRGPTAFPFVLAGNASTTGASHRVALRVFDAAGRPVNTVLEDVLPPGNHEASWNGLSDQGLPVTAGVYFARLDVDGRAVSARRMVRLP